MTGKHSAPRRRAAPVPRRTVLRALALIPLVGGLAAAADRARPPLIDVRLFGARGDGSTDDSEAIAAAVDALAPGGVLHFPAGSYRYARRGRDPGDAAIRIDGKSGVSVDFAAGAELLMDNLDGEDGTSHGVAVYGACTDIRLSNVAVRWRTAPTKRSFGDAFRFLGYPGDSPPPPGWTATTGSVTRVTLVDCSATGAPQTGCIFMGCSDGRVVRFSALATLADGLHFNACWGVEVDGLRAVDTGDDGLAFVTYAADEVPQGEFGPFNQPVLAAWSNSAARARDVSVSGGAANGCRVAGSMDVEVSRLTVREKAQAGVIVDSAIVGDDIAWTYHASRRVAFSEVDVQDCPIGVRVPTQNVSLDDGPDFWLFDARFTDLSLRGCSNYAIRTEGDGTAGGAVGGLTFDGVRIEAGSGGGGGGGAVFSALRESSVSNLSMTTSTGAPVAVIGRDVPLAGPTTELADQRVTVRNVRSVGGGILFQDVGGLTVADVRSTRAPVDGMQFVRVRDCTARNVEVQLPNRSSRSVARGCLFEKVVDCTVSKLTVRTDRPTSSGWRSLEVGGGDRVAPAASGLRIDRFTYESMRDQTTDDVVVQTGVHGPVGFGCQGRYLNSGEDEPTWRPIELSVQP